MAKSVVGLNIKIGANVATLQRDLGKAAGSVRQFGANASGAAAGVGTLQSSIATLSRYIGPMVVAMAAFRGIKFAANLAAETEQATVAFTTMLGSAEKAKQVLSDLAEFSAATPFELSELRDSARLLIANNLPAEQLIQTMKVLGDLASGTGAPLIEITRIFNKMRATGRVTLENINELMLRNIPIWDILSEKTGKSKDEIRAMATAGKISFDLMNETLTSLTEKGGLFADSMKKQSSTLTGVLSTLKDNIALLALEVGNKLLPFFKSMAEATIAVTVAIRGLDASTVQSIAQVAAFTAGFAAVVLIVPRVVAAIRSIIVTLRALTVAATIAQGATGVGLAKALLGLAAGVAAAYAVGKAFDEMTDAGKDASDGIDKAAGAVEGFKAASAGVSEEWQAIGDKIRESVATPAEQLKARLDEIHEAFKAGAIEPETYARAVKSVQDEIDKLDPGGFKAIGDKIRDSVATPAEKLREKLKEIRGALAAGAIDFEIYGRAIRGAIEEFGELSKAKDAFSATPSIGAAVRGTSGGFSAVQDGQRVMQDLVAFAKKKEEADKRRDKFLADMLEELESIAESVEEPLKVKEHDII